MVYKYFDILLFRAAPIFSHLMKGVHVLTTEQKHTELMLNTHVVPRNTGLNIRVVLMSGLSLGAVVLYSINGKSTIIL